MKVRFRKNYERENGVFEIEDLVESELDGDDYESGAVEAARATADKAVRCLARLLDHLAETRFINSKEFQQILYGKGLITQHFEFIYPEVISGRNTKQGETP